MATLTMAILTMTMDTAGLYVILILFFFAVRRTHYVLSTKHYVPSIKYQVARGAWYVERSVAAHH